MYRFFRFHLLTILSIVLNTNIIFPCDCGCEGDCSFSVVSQQTELVALVKVISYDDFLEAEIMNYDGKMPYSMTVEIIDLYKGEEKRKHIKIWGDNGVLCRPYIARFKIGEYYLIATNKLNKLLMDENEKPDDYDFFVCQTDYLRIDLTKRIAYGEYMPKQMETNLDEIIEDIKNM